MSFTIKKYPIKLSEDRQQEDFIKWCNLSSACYPCLKFIFAIPNGGKRTIKTGALLKRTGTKAGVPDLFLPFPVQQYSGLFLEFKVNNNKLTNEQNVYYDYLNNNNYLCCVVYSCTEAVALTIKYLTKK